MKGRHIYALSLAALAGGGFTAAAQTNVEHYLTVAANSSLLVDNAEVDAIISDMNRIMHSTKYAWDVSCPAVSFVRHGDVIQSDQLLLTGTYQQLSKSVGQVAPSANVLMVLSIDCSGIKAAGCGPMGGEPMVVGTYPGFDSQLWLHERGHNVRLPHSAEFPATDSSSPQNVGYRFMFWRLGVGHEGKNFAECNLFDTAQLASIVAKNSGTPLVAAVPAAPVAPNPVAAAGPAAAIAPGTDMEGDTLEAEAKKAGLTKAAFKVVGPPWVEAIPLDEIRALKTVDINSIRTMLRGEPNEYWPQALAALAVVGNASDVALANHALELPVPAVAADAILDQNAKDKFRLLMRIKLSAPNALGILANRTHSGDAVEILKTTTDLSIATTLIGPTAANTLSKSALTGLSISNSPKAKAYLDQVVKPSAASGSENRGNQPMVAPLTDDDVEHFGRIEAAVKNHGLETYIRSGEGG